MKNETQFEIKEIIPDPAAECFSFTYSGNDKELSVFLYNIYGQLMKKEEFNELPPFARRNVNINGLSEGDYFVKFLQERKQYTYKIHIC